MTGLGARIAVFATVLRSPILRRVQLAFAVFNIGEWATWIAILVYAYGRGGAVEAGVVALIQLAPASVAAPAAAVLADRISRLAALRASYLAQALAMGATAWALAADSSALVVYPLAAVTAATVTFSRPAQAALLPSLARTTEELTAANVASGTIQNAGLLLGPAVAGIVLGVAGPAHVFGAMAVALLLGGLALPGRRPTGQAARPDRPHHERGTIPTFAGALVGGLRALRDDRPARLVVGLLAASQLALGALDVFYVVLALDVLGLGQGGVGLLNGAVGAGGLVGSAAAIALVGRRRLGPPLVAGLVVFGVAVAATGIAPIAGLAVGLLLVAGAGRSFSDVAGWTMLQRVVPDAVLARIFGILEGVNMAAQGVGALLASALVAALGSSGAMVVAGMILAVLAVVRAGSISAAERRVAIPSRELDLLRTVPMLAPLEPPVLERLAGRAIRLTLPAGAVVIREGEAGDRFYVVAAGRVRVTADGRRRRDQGPGESFGAAALLRDAPRSATVVALGPVELLALEREPFLEAVTGLRATGGVTERVGDQGLVVQRSTED